MIGDVVEVAGNGMTVTVDASDAVIVASQVSVLSQEGHSELRDEDELLDVVAGSHSPHEILEPEAEAADAVPEGSHEPEDVDEPATEVLTAAGSQSGQTVVLLPEDPDDVGRLVPVG